MKKIILLSLILVACESTPITPSKSAEEIRIEDSIQNATERKAYLNDSTKYNEEQKNVADLKKKQTQSSSDNTSSNLRIIGSGTHSTKLSKRMAYLTKQDDVKWVEIDNNTVYIGVTSRNDLQTLCNGAAYHGNREIDFGCHVFAIDANKYSSSTASNYNYIYETTCRYGKFE